MFIIFLLMFTPAMATLPSFYHSSHEIMSDIQDVCRQSPHVSCIGNHVKITGTKHDKPNLIVVAEHARECITSELALHAIHEWAVHPPIQDTWIIPIVNKWGRQQVERGNDCLRTNVHGVDLNRNYPFGFQRRVRGSETYPGRYPLSENESKQIHTLLHQIQPHTYISIHSGEYALYLPWDFKMTNPPHYEDMMKRVHVWKRSCLTCITGPAAQVSHYKAYGTGVDHAMSVATHAFTFEIYGNEQASSCLARFNPLDQPTYKETLRKWMLILKEL